MIPQPLQRLDRHYAHLDPVRIDAANARLPLVRLFGRGAEPTIPYVLCNPKTPLIFPDYYAALATLGLDAQDLEEKLKPGAHHIYREPDHDPEGGKSQRFLKWAAYVSPDSSHVVLEIASPYHIAGFCFAKTPGGGIALDQMFAGNAQTHHTINMTLDQPGINTVRSHILAAARRAITDIRGNPKGSTARFSALLSPVLRYLENDAARRKTNFDTHAALAGFRRNTTTLAHALDDAAGKIHVLTRENLIPVLHGAEAIAQAAEKMQQDMQALQKQNSTLHINAQKAVKALNPDNL